MRRFDLVLAIVVSAIVSAVVAAALPSFGALTFSLGSLAVGIIAVGRAYASWQEEDIE